MTGPADNRLVLGFNAAQRHLFMRVRLLQLVIPAEGSIAMICLRLPGLVTNTSPGAAKATPVLSNLFDQHPPY